MGKLKTSVLYLPRPASDYPGCYPLWFEEHLSELLESNNYIHLFSGKAGTGFKVDIKMEEIIVILTCIKQFPRIVTFQRKRN